MTERQQVKNKVSKRAQLLDIVDKEQLKKLLSAFTKATDLTANIVDVNGRSIFSKEDAQKSCKFCQRIRQLEREKGLNRCQGAYARAGKQAALFGEPYIFRCPAGLIEWAAPIIINGEHLGSIICGQVLMWEPEEFFWIELRDMNKDITDDFYQLIDLAKELRVVSLDKVQGAADLLYVTANYIMQSGWESLKYRKEIAKHESILNEEIRNRKKLEEELKIKYHNVDYSMHKEKELSKKIIAGESEEAKKIFNDLLADIGLHSGLKLKIVKSRVLELGVVLSRAAADGGADLNKALDISSDFMQQITSLKSIEEINFVAKKTLEKFLKAIANRKAINNQSAIKGIKEYIHVNWRKNPTLEEISYSVYLSPNYASKLFREDQGITIMEYLTQVKMEEAKKQLSTTKKTVEEIAEELGYNDASYFTKVFRRKEGITPSKYRRLHKNEVVV